LLFGPFATLFHFAPRRGKNTQNGQNSICNGMRCLGEMSRFLCLTFRGGAEKASVFINQNRPWVYRYWVPGWSRKGTTDSIDARFMEILRSVSSNTWKGESQFVVRGRIARDRGLALEEFKCTAGQPISARAKLRAGCRGLNRLRKKACFRFWRIKNIPQGLRTYP